jgi:tetratricopeptide (TPR) repeat protein
VRAPPQAVGCRVVPGAMTPTAIGATPAGSTATSKAGLADLDQAIRLDPNFGNAYYNRGLAWEAKDDLQSALADFQKYVELVPGNADGSRALERVRQALRARLR